ncbi:MAG: arylesterase [Oscillospiraceae bacterium]|nr:arylesterase [Oscillospiraceae bacterium]MBP1567469.1 arylesterase [Oscillospiraceae bacterium]MBP1590745.1 arylesterase [Oscillospiraceae bacterium]MBQ5335983.1 arylesterase [Oscillospiraceae bacterium]
MRQVICFGDSNTFGYIPGTGKRYTWGKRWTSILSEKLSGTDSRVVEEGLVGRTTIFEDPLRDGRCGVKLLPVILETHAPSDEDLVVIMLGTNDCKAIYGASPEVIAKGVGRLVRQVKAYSDKVKILIISPIHLGENVWKEGFDPEFDVNSVEISKKLAAEYRKISKAENTYFLDASEYAVPSETDEEHMDEENHSRLALAVYEKIRDIRSA